MGGHWGVAQPACCRGAVTVICPLRVGAEGTLPVGGSRGLDLLFHDVWVKVFICFFILYLFTIAWSRNGGTIGATGHSMR